MQRNFRVLEYLVFFDLWIPDFPNPISVFYGCRVERFIARKHRFHNNALTFALLTRSSHGSVSLARTALLLEPG